VVLAENVAGRGRAAAALAAGKDKTTHHGGLLRKQKGRPGGRPFSLF
jgi:hypothetical protein